MAASLEQRGSALEDTNLPGGLIEAGQTGLAADYIRDGNRLRVSEDKALRLSVGLHNVGWKQEALRVFELAEPLEYLSGRLIEDRHRSAQDLRKLLVAWVESASLLRDPAVVVASVRRIAIAPSFQDREKDSGQLSRQLQNWLLAQGALACGQRADWETWQVFLETLNGPEDGRRQVLTLLQTADLCFRAQQHERGRQTLMQFLGLSGSMTAATSRQQKDNYLTVSWLALLLGIENAQGVAQAWIDRAGLVPLSDQEVTDQNVTKLYWLQYRYARIRFILNETLTVELLLQEAEAATTYGPYEEDDTKLARRQLHRIVISLAKLWVEAHLGYQREPAVFKEKVTWILDLIESGWRSQSPSLQLEVTCLRN